jgi:hypothetical protein
MRTLRIIGSTALALLLLGSSGAGAATLQPLGSFDDPIYVSSDPSNPQRLFIVERGGLIQQLEDGRVGTFADISSEVGCGSGGCTGERGLLSMAPAPDFRSSGRFYVDYANNVDGSIHIAELRASGATAASGTLRNVLTIDHPGDSNHNGGQLQFGPDGYLYISTGDGGGKDDEHENSQNLDSLLGKILRIDPRQSGVLPYSVPAGNPFVGTIGAKPEIWSYGLRNPFRFSFDRLSGDLMIGDVGQSAREEVDYAPAPLLGAGANYGWNCREGREPGPAEDPDPQCATTPLGSFTEPVFDYPHSEPVGGGAHGCAIIGGYVARDPSLGALYGRYVYGDHCSGEIRSLDLADPFASDRPEILALGELDSFGEDSCGRLYVVSSDGEVLRLAGAAPAICSPSATPVIDRAPKVPTLLGIKAVSRHVKRGKRATITAWVSPCPGRRGDPVKLWRGRRELGTRHLDRVCSVRFRPRIGRRLNFRATIREDSEFLPAQSRRLTIRIRHLSPKR